MLSVLIPIYNYDAFPLVDELHRQCLESEMQFEIICIDDASTEFISENNSIELLSNCNFSVLPQNIGRSQIRNLLAHKSKYDWLLFLDCDIFPSQKNFIQKYIQEIDHTEKVVFGGLEYEKEMPNKNQLLRWVYGNERETLSVEKRNTNPNKNALASNLLIQKEIFFDATFDQSITTYGYEDLVFFTNLRKKGIRVKHIHNPTNHLGLETSLQFLEKTKNALNNLKTVYNKSLISTSESKLLQYYAILKRLYLVRFYAFLFSKAHKKIEQNLLSKNPSLLLFDLYKLGFFCTI